MNFYVHTPEAAASLGITVDRLRHLADTGVIPFTSIGLKKAKFYRFWTKDLETLSRDLKQGTAQLSVPSTPVVEGVKYLPVDEVKRILNVHGSTVYNYIKSGRLKGVREGSRWYADPVSVALFKESAVKRSSNGAPPARPSAVQVPLSFSEATAPEATPRAVPFTVGGKIFHTETAFAETVASEIKEIKNLLVRILTRIEERV